MSNKKIPEASIDPVSYCAMPINLINFESGTTLAKATGFLFKSSGIYFLITNWHNVTGVDPVTKKRIDTTHAASPTGIEIPLLECEKPFIKWRRVKLPLYSSRKPKWYIHPRHGEQVDVIAIEVGENDESEGGLPIKAINEVKFDDIQPQVADNVFILGFPHDLTSGGNFPIWKRGSIASEPDIDLKGLPKILIDTASRPGMSGAPVVARRQGIHKFIDGKPTDSSFIGEAQVFCGIYSGRIKANTELDTQLGIVWKAGVIEEIIEGKKSNDKYYPDESFA